MSTNPEGRAWLRVQARALRGNFGQVRASVGPATRIIPMVKADAYGLGVVEVVRTLALEKPWGWGVATLDEGLGLRDLGVSDPVVVFTPLSEASIEAAVRADLHVSVSNLESLAWLSAAGRRLGRRPSIHVDVDTGMGRSGFDWRAADSWLPAVVEAARRDVAWVGCFTHLHSAEDDLGSVRVQWVRFEDILARLDGPPSGLMIHMLNSPGAFRAPEYAEAAVRPGIFLYGGEIGPGLPRPEPVVSLHARVVHVREAPVGTTLGYGATYVAARPERWATLSIGYGDGLPRALGNRGSAIIAGARVPIVGRISMDMTVVDITDVPGVQLGDVATLLGAEGREAITVDDVAELAGTISYEVLIGFTARLPRVWVD
jgi:alanine racemase